MEKKKALVLFSGGLDGMIAYKLLEEQGIEVTGVFFETFFFGSEQVLKIAEANKMKIRVVDIGEKHWEVVKKPKYGYGSAMNPCVDCHLLMLKEAKKIMEKEGFDFVATGEVLGERPMSQNKKSLKIIEEEAGLEGFVLRPLSAKLLSPTLPEQKGWVNREKLLAIQGRSRKIQLELAKKMGLVFPTPAGGCILTDKIFGEKLRELLSRKKDLDKNEIELLKTGRHFWEDKIKIVVGRNQEENKKLWALARKGDLIIELNGVPGPTTLIRNYSGEEVSAKVVEKAKKLTKNYANKAKIRKNLIDFMVKESNNFPSLA